jgi:glycosyltransferase involved in cell wall biosynthesis
MTRRVVLIPVYNEERHLEGLLSRLREVYQDDVLLIDDGSQDASPSILRGLSDARTRSILCEHNRGYGATLNAGFQEVIRQGYEFVITMDSDGQHRPDWIPGFFNTISDWDIVSGSRYCAESDKVGHVPPDRREINAKVTARINEITGFGLTDSFCGFKAYRVAALAKLNVTDMGYAMPLQVWMQAKYHQLRVVEMPVSRIYDDPNRRFGGELDNPEVRLTLYLDTIERERGRWNL